MHQHDGTTLCTIVTEWLVRQTSTPVVESSRSAVNQCTAVLQSPHTGRGLAVGRRLDKPAPNETPGVPFAFKDSMIHWILIFTLCITACCVLHRCTSQEFHHQKLSTFSTNATQPKLSKFKWLKIKKPKGGEFSPRPRGQDQWVMSPEHPSACWQHTSMDWAELSSPDDQCTVITIAVQWQWICSWSFSRFTYGNLVMTFTSVYFGNTSLEGFRVHVVSTIPNVKWFILILRVQLRAISVPSWLVSLLTPVRSQSVAVAYGLTTLDTILCPPHILLPSHAWHKQYACKWCLWQELVVKQCPFCLPLASCYQQNNNNAALFT